MTRPAVGALLWRRAVRVASFRAMRRWRRSFRVPASALAAAAILAGLLLAGRPASAQTPGATGAGPDATVIYLVRHAETAPDATHDPSLSPAGEERARWLGVILSHARLDAVYTTEYRRTRRTAALPALAAGVEPTPYDPTDLAGLARALEERGGRVLVVGHSNTTPQLVDLLGGDAGPPIDEDEHDRLYVLVLEHESVRTVVLRY